MPVDSKNPQYTAFASKQQKCRDAYEGEDKIKDRTTEYLKPLSGMAASGDKYKGYLDRAMFYAATRRTVEGLTGIVNRKPPTIEIYDGLPWEEDIDGYGMSLHGFAKQVMSEAVLIGWQGILVDKREDYEQPYPIQYLSEQIINWHLEDGKLQMVMLAESVFVREEYEVKSVEQWRELALINGIYTVKTYRRNSQKKIEIVSTDTPTIRGDFFDMIPFYFVSTDNKLENPPLLDMVNINLHHYKNSADHENALHFTGIPTPVLTGVNQPTDSQGNNVPIELGSETCIILSETGASASYLEYGGTGLAPIASAMAEKKLEMASLGARMLTSDKKGVEAAETARINKSGDSNVMASVVTGVERALNATLRMMSVWQSLNPDLNTIELNRDFVDSGLSSQDLTAIVGSFQGGTMSLETAVYNHKKNDLLKDDRTIEEEISAIKAQAPNLNEEGLDLSGGDEDE